MRQISLEETAAVGGADCGDLTMSVGLTGASISGSLSNWSSCVSSGLSWVADQYNGFTSQYLTGIPYGEPHVA